MSKPSFVHEAAVTAGSKAAASSKVPHLQRTRSAIGISWELATRDIASNFRQSKLGFLWMLLQPALYGLIFVIIKFGMSNAGFEIDTGNVSPALFALVGMTLYQAWIEALQRQLDSIRSMKSMLKTVRIPSSALFLAPSFISMIHLAARLCAILVVFTAQAIGALLLPIASLYRDVSQFVSSIAMGILLLSPILYPATTNTDSILHKINLANPLGSTVNTARDLLLGGEFILLTSTYVWLGLAIAFAVIGIVWIRTVLPILLERLS
jgi:lipopolysaccharide transport system permease protein